MIELLIAQTVVGQTGGEYTLIGGGAAIISALTGAVTYLWRRAEAEFDECKQDRKKLWAALESMGYHSRDLESHKGQ